MSNQEPGRSRFEWEKTINQGDRSVRMSWQGFKAAVIRMLQWIITNMLGRNEKKKSLSKEMQNISKNYMEILELEIAISERKKLNA